MPGGAAEPSRRSRSTDTRERHPARSFAIVEPDQHAALDVVGVENDARQAREIATQDAHPRALGEHRPAHAGEAVLPCLGGLQHVPQHRAPRIRRERQPPSSLRFARRRATCRVGLGRSATGRRRRRRTPTLRDATLALQRPPELAVARETSLVSPSLGRVVDARHHGVGKARAALTPTPVRRPGTARSRPACPGSARRSRCPGPSASGRDPDDPTAPARRCRRTCRPRAPRRSPDRAAS